MPKQTFAEKIFGAPAGSIVFHKPDIVLSHDNTASIEGTFRKMGSDRVADPGQLLIVLDHNAPPTNSKLANDYQQIRNFVGLQGIRHFHDVGDGICHQLMEKYARPSMVVVGSDSHTCTAGAFNAFAAGIDRTETAGLWKQGETWFRVPESVKITLTGKLPENVYAKDLALYIIGMIGSDGADYLSVEYHGEGVASLTVAERMTIANLASEMGAKNAVFPADDMLQQYLGEKTDGVWADNGARYLKEYTIELTGLYPVVACPHHVDNVRSVDEVAGTKLEQALIGTCTNGRLEDLRTAAGILKGHKVAAGMQLLVTPASREIYLQAIREGLIEVFIQAGATLLTPSCGPCLGTGQGIPPDGINIISTANRNFLGRMGNARASIYLASPATVAISALKGEITSPARPQANNKFPFQIRQSPTLTIQPNDDRYAGGIWNYSDADNLNTDQMFAGNLTYEINSSQPDKIAPHLFKGFDGQFAAKARQGDILICGDNFGCGSSREHPAVGLVFLGIKAVIAKSVSRIFYRSALNQGLPVLVLPEAVNAYRQGDPVSVDLAGGAITIAGIKFNFNPLPDKLMQILEQGGLVEWINGKK
ncbi:MAG TPA: aconitase/3-isopropylmalate dehydratase large subunit family protein [Bacteroidales bacterium]|nr:aconitase/3-isopropylmalate dehydratase large subunit family protein [Bacteroidales bacterium]